MSKHSASSRWVVAIVPALLLTAAVVPQRAGALPRHTTVAQPGEVAAADPDAAAAIERLLTTATHPALKWSHIADVTGTLGPLYRAEADRLLWFENGRPLPTLGAAVQAMGAVSGHGFDPADFDAAFLATEWTTMAGGSAHGPDRAQFDLAVSVSALRLLRAAHVGRVDPATMHWGYSVAAKRFEAAARLRDARLGAGLAAAIDALAPPVTHYQRARQTLAAYQALAARGEPAAVPPPPAGRTRVTPGDAWSGLPALVTRLQAFGDLRPGAEAPATYTAPLVEAVRSFQARHGLDRDGVIGAGTLKALNVPVADRVRQIELAMERMRWLPDLSGRPNVFVNVPLFRLWATDPVSGEEPLRMNVVVGQSMNHQTPLFIEEMEYVIFRPYWNPPYGITVKELVPHARRDPSYFDREALEIVASGDDAAQALPPTPENLSAVVAGRLHLRQRPGPQNSLGLAKFIFPNSENVYMHGTPAQQLFARTRRDFSHGCIRLEDPARFASWVLRDQPAWTRPRIDAAMQAERPTRVDLPQRLRVVLFYDTVHVDSEGVVHFADDIYGHDRTLDAALQRGYPYPQAR